MDGTDDQQLARFRSLIAFCDRHAPGFARSVRPAAPGDLERLERLAGKALPAEYRAFMAVMGGTAPRTLGRFLAYVDFGLAAVERHYRDPPFSLPRDATFLWTYEHDSPFLVFMHDAAGSDGLRPLVQLGWRIDPVTGALTVREGDLPVLAAGLLPYLYEEAYDTLRVPSLPFRSCLEEVIAFAKPDPERSAERQSVFEATMRRLGFAPLPFAEPSRPLFDRADAAASMASSSHAADTVFVGADDERECRRLTDALIRALGLRER